MQSKLMSFLEAAANTLLGFVLSVIASQVLLVYVYGLNVSLQMNASITFWMTVVSFVRSYVVRRIFNKGQ